MNEVMVMVYSKIKSWRMREKANSNMDEKVISANQISSQDNQSTALTYDQALSAAIQNETSFINDMEFLNTLLNHPGLKGNVLSLDKCILNVSNILTAHRNLRDEFCDKTCLVSCAFFNFMPHLKIYIDYVCCVERVNTCIQKITTPCVGELWKQSSKLLSAPIQHLAKYKEIIGGFRKCLLEQESKPLKDILEAIEKTVVQVNTICKTTENALKIHQIQKSICNAQPKIFAPGRVFLKEGCLLKINKNGHGHQHRVFFLFSDILLCCKKLKTSQDWYKKSSLLCHAIIPLHLCSIHSVWKLYDGHNPFEIRWETNSCKLFSKEDGVIQSWVVELEQAIECCKDILSAQEIKNKCSSLRRNTFVRKTSQPMLKRRSESNLEQDSTKNHTSSLKEPKRKKKLSLKQSFKALFH